MPELCQKGDFSPEIRMKGIFVYALECMLTLDKMQILTHLAYRDNAKKCVMSNDNVTVLKAR